MQNLFLQIQKTKAQKQLAFGEKKKKTAPPQSGKKPVLSLSK